MLVQWMVRLACSPACIHGDSDMVTRMMICGPIMVTRMITNDDSDGEL